MSEEEKKFLEIVDLKKGFGSGQTRQEVLRGMNFSVAKGEFCVLLGPSGSGKSTLLNIIGGIVLPVRSCNLCSCFSSQWTWLSAWLWSRKTCWHEYRQKENHCHRSWHAECGTGNKPCHNDRTVFRNTGVCDHLRSFLHLAFYFRNIACRHVCSL